LDALPALSWLRISGLYVAHYVNARTEELMPKGKLTPEGEVIAADRTAMVAAFQVLINCLEENDACCLGNSPMRFASKWKW
jgi:hypothetical protein